MEARREVTSVSLVVPCFNEAARLRTDEIEVLRADGRVSIVLVDDGSTDGTIGVLRRVEAAGPRVDVIATAANRGKGEAVRAGLRHAQARGAAWLGYLDADFSTPAVEMLRLLDVAGDHPEAEVVIGSRVALLGRDIRRSPFRHYTGRVFATLASHVLDKPVYDTQCGTKLLRASDALAHALAAPFRSRWAFDVELLGRLAANGVPPTAFWEEPLHIWHDRDDSRRSLTSSLRTSAELLAIRRDLRARRS